jgi:hypothetical protein
VSISMPSLPVLASDVLPTAALRNIKLLRFTSSFISQSLGWDSKLIKPTHNLPDLIIPITGTRLQHAHPDDSGGLGAHRTQP